MKNLKFLLLIAFPFLFLSNCQNVNSPIPEGNSKFPISMGNYWVFDSQVKSDIHKLDFSYRDSMVITAVRNYEDYRVAEIELFNNGKLYDTIEIYVSSNLMYLKSQVLFPFMFLDQSVCMTRSPDTVKPIIHFDYPAYHIVDTVAGDTYPSLVDDGHGGYETVNSTTRHEYIYDIVRNGSSDFNFNNSNFASEKWTINLEHLYSITYPDNVMLKPIQGCTYLNKGRTIIANTGWLELTLADGIGIVESKSVLYHCDSIIWAKNMKLLDFNLK